MTLTIDEILERVAWTEGERAGYSDRAARWEDMWKLKVFTQTAKEAWAEGKEQVTLPEPYDVVNLALRLLSNTPSIDVPAEDVDADKDESAERRQQFLAGLWHRSNREQRVNLVKNAAWMGLVRGRFVFDVRWIGDQLPKRLQGRRLPLLIRTLDPLACGVKYGPMGPIWAFHKYDDDRLSVLQRWPEMKGSVADKSGAKGDDDTLEVTDFWWAADGSIWNAVLVDGQFAQEPTETDYPDIPIIEGTGDATPLADEEYKGLSILHGLDGVWQYKCRLASQMGTGLLWYFWPAIVITNEFGLETNNIDITPGTTNRLERGTKVDVVQTSPNVPLAQAMMAQMEAASSKSTFPGVMYGESPSGLQAGYGINLLADAAKGRINALRESMEWAMATVNEIALGLVEAYAGAKGVAVWGWNEGTEGIVNVKLTPSDIDGYYENYVRITPSLPQDDLQKQGIGLQQISAGILSRRTYRQKFLNFAVPSDEEERILIEEAMTADQVKKLGLEQALRDYFGPDASQYLDALNGGGPQAGPGAGPMSPGGPMSGPGPMGGPMTGPGPEMAGPGGPMSGPPPPMAGPGGPSGGLPPELMQMMMAQGGPGGPGAGPGGPPQGPPGYRPASDPALSCASCGAFQQGMCLQFGVPVQEMMTCEAWVPGQGGPGPMGGDEIPPEDQVLL